MRGASKRPVGDVGGRQARLEPHFEVSENRRDASSSDGKGLRGDSRAHVREWPAVALPERRDRRVFVAPDRGPDSSRFPRNQRLRSLSFLCNAEVLTCNAEVSI